MRLDAHETPAAHSQGWSEASIESNTIEPTRKLIVRSRRSGLIPVKPLSKIGAFPNPSTKPHNSAAM
jgi:hypothetical protein